MSLISSTRQLNYTGYFMSNQALEQLTAWSTFATAVVAAIALVVASLQIVKSNATQREATAQDAYKEYLRLAIETPDFADGVSKLPEKESDRTKYSWFVTYFLHSAEHVFLLEPSDEWRAAISTQVCLHKVYLAGEEYQKILKFHYDKKFREFVDRSLASCP